MRLSLLAICPYCSTVSEYHLERENAPRTRHFVTCPKCDKVFSIEITGKININSMELKKPKNFKTYKPSRDGGGQKTGGG